MTEQLTKAQLERMSPEQLRRHILRAQHDQNRDDNQRQAELAQAHDTVRQLSRRITELSAQLQESERARSRDVSFYWGVIADLGRTLNVDVPEAAPGTTLDEDWRNYAQAVRRQVCGSPATT
jgi:hypothetical protein